MGSCSTLLKSQKPVTLPSTKTWPTAVQGPKDVYPELITSTPPLALTAKSSLTFLQVQGSGASREKVVLNDESTCAVDHRSAQSLHAIDSNAWVAGVKNDAQVTVSCSSYATAAGVECLAREVVIVSEVLFALTMSPPEKVNAPTT